jgi:hypothetical protein
VKRLDGSTPSCSEELLKDWAKYFDTLLNNKSQEASQATRPEPSPDNPEIDTNPISRAEVVAAVKSLNRNKSPGPDYAMTAEVLKDGGEFIINQLYIIIKLVYDNNFPPSYWTTSLITPIPKKGNQLMTNYRGISLMSIAAKVFNEYC